MISRLWQNLGFGIQSPNDYAFLHDVIREKLLYYGYEDIVRSHPDASGREIRVMQLVFRVRNAFHGENVVVVRGDEAVPPLHDVRALVLLPEHIEKSLFNLHPFLLENPLWKELQSQSHVVTFDMIDLGIAIFNRRRYAEHYKIMPV